MRWYDALAMAWKGRGRLGLSAGLFLLGSALGVTLAGGRTMALEKEKSQPWELQVSVEEFSEEDLAAICAVEGVIDVTPVYEIPLELAVGACTQEITVYGVRGEYLQKNMLDGELFSGEDTASYLVINRAAWMAFRDTTGQTVAADALPDWRQSAVWLRNGGSGDEEEGEADKGAQFPARICGICLEGETPEAYMDAERAKQLLRSRGETPTPSRLLVRITDAGTQEAVSEALAGLGAMAENTDEESMISWRQRGMENGYTAVLSLVCFLAAVSLLHLRISYGRAGWQRENEALEAVGMAKGVYGHIGRLSVGLYVVVWAAAGVCAGLLAL